MILLRLMSWPYFRKHVLRTILTAAGVVLGVAVFVGMHTANQSVLSAFSQTVDRIAGKTQLQITAGETGFGEDVLDKVQSASTVRVAVPVIEAVVDSNIKGQGNLLVLGTDMTGDRSLRDYDLDSADAAVIDDPLVFLAQPDSLMLSKEFADRNHLATGSRLPLGTVDGAKMFTVRGILRASGLASAFGGNLAVMDIYAAQKMFGRGRTFDRIDLAVKPGTTLAECERELGSLLGPAFDIQPPATRGQQFEAVLAGYAMLVNISSAFALFIGMFIIYNSFAIAVTQRRSEIGILRAIGATRGQIRWLFLGESAVLGLVGSIVGVALGVLLAHAIASSVSAVIADVYFVAQRADEPSASPIVLGLALGLGVATSLLAAVIPARNAARVDPVHALKKGRYQVLPGAESRLRVGLAIVLGIASVACLTVTGSRPIFYAGYVLAVMVVPLLLGPLLSLGLARTIRPVLKWLRPVEGALAADSLIQAPRRTSASVVAVMLSLALVVAFSGMAGASYDSIVDWMNATFNPDLFVSPTESFDIQTTRFPATMAPEIAALPGVERVQMFRDSRIIFRKTPITLVAIEMASVADTARRRPVAGNAADMYKKAAASEGLIVSDNLAELQHLTLGETLEIPAPYGLIRLPIVGIIVDYTDQQGTILMDRSLFIKYWHDDSVRDFRVYLKSGVAASAVREGIQERYAGQRQVFVLTNHELKSYILKITDQWFGLTSVQIAVAVLVAILGIVNTLTVSIIDRRRELGVLRAVGAVRGQIRRTIWIEALTVGVIGLILGYALGAVNLYYMLQIVHRDIAGLRLDYVFPVKVALALVPTILGAAFVAAVWPAESAVRGSLVEALEYE
jgi:putative ABC transport system permease protein